MTFVRPASTTALLAGGFFLLVGACGGGSEPAPAAGTKATPATGAKEASKAPAPTKAGKGPASAQLAYQTGLQLLLKGDPQKALGEFERATNLDARMSEAFYELGKLYVHLSSQTVGSQARDMTILEKGLVALARAKELEPANDEYWFRLGKAHYVKNAVPEALTCLSKSVELNGGHAQAWKMLGRVQMETGKIAEARASFQRSIESDPSDAGAFFQLGQALEQLTELENARAAYEKSLAIRSTEPEVFGRLLTVCAALGDAECEARARAGMEAWTEYDRTLKLARREVNQNPSDAKALRRLGVLYFEVGRWEEALEWFMRSIHVDPRDAKTHLFCGITRRHLRDHVNAMNHLKEAEFLAPDNLDPKLELLRLYAESKEDDPWRELLAKTEDEAVTDGAALYDLGLVCQETGRAEDAARLFGKAKALGVTEPPSRSPDAAQGK
jgi:tetratricopeptide (TPR) repeat protein